jgi:nitrate reductase gamma subunit
MEGWIDFAKGPLFAFAFLVMVLGLLRLVVIQVYFLATRKGRRLVDVKWGGVLKDTMSWIVPIRHVAPGTIVFSSASFLMHIGVLIVPVLLMDHVAMWESFVGLDLPAIGREAADFLTLFTIGCILVLLCCRTFVARQRIVSRRSDYLLLLLVLAPFASGYCASHPAVNPLPWDTMMLVHLFSAEALFVAVPFTKLAHVVLYFFDRLSAVHWQLRPGAGALVAEALRREEAAPS